MHLFRSLRPLGAVLALAFVSCNPGDGVSPRPPLQADVSVATDQPAVRISEIHYDNTGTDAGERIEISGPAGTDLTGWSVVLYNGTGGAAYNTRALAGPISATCDARGVVVLDYPSNGIQNGSPDGIALVDPAAVVVEFLSYEGTFTAVGGPANGQLSVDIGVAQNGTEPLGSSLGRSGAGVWTATTPLGTNTFGACNDNDEPPPPQDVATVTVSPASATVAVGGTQTFTAAAFDAANQPIAGATFTWSTTAPAIADVNASGVATGLAPGDAGIVATATNGVADTAELHVDVAPPPPPSGPVAIVEIHYDNGGADVGEAVEVEGPAGTNLSGWSIVLYNGNGGVTYGTLALSGTLTDQCDGRGVVSVPALGLQNGSPDGLALVNAGGAVVEFLSYEGAFSATNGPASGTVSTDIGVTEAGSEPAGRSLQKDAAGWYGPATASFGACNLRPPPLANTIVFTGRTAGDPALPVGFQDQLFATLLDGGGNAVPTTFSWSSETPALASIDQNGVMTALGEGTATIRATAADGTARTVSLPTRVAVASTTALYAGNAEFGEPADGDPSDDFIVRHAQYTASYNRNRGTPNWVSYDLDPTHFGPEDRCDCFTFDPALPAAFTHYTTADYTGAGAFHGFGIDRGHLARSFDRTSASLDNAFTFYFTNIVPQAADLNQGPWAVLENVLGDFARFQDREVYIVAGVAGTKGTVKNEGKITIPASTWKIAVILPHDHGLADVHSYQDVEVIAVIMPNDPGIRNVPWETYKTTVDAVEAASGYDLLARLPDPIEIAVESNTKPPSAASDGPYAGTEGSAVAMSAAASSDPDGDLLTYAWTFGDGTGGSGVAPSHTYAQDGLYPIRLIVRDIRGLADTTETSATVANVAPTIAAFDGATLLPGETYAVLGSFSDPGSDSWTATVDYGDGSGVRALALAGATFSLNHRYMAAGTFTVSVRISDDDVTAGRVQTVTVLTPVQGVENVIGLVGRLGAGNSLVAKLDAAVKQLVRGRIIPAVNQLESFLHELDAMVRSGRLSPADAAPLGEAIRRVIQSVQP